MNDQQNNISWMDEFFKRLDKKFEAYQIEIALTRSEELRRLAVKQVEVGFREQALNSMVNAAVIISQLKMYNRIDSQRMANLLNALYSSVARSAMDAEEFTVTKEALQYLVILYANEKVFSWTRGEKIMRLWAYRKLAICYEKLNDKKRSQQALLKANELNESDFPEEMDMSDESLDLSFQFFGAVM